MKKISSILAIVGLAVFTFTAVPTLSAATPESFADLAEENLDAVVNVSTTQIIDVDEQQNRENVPPGFRDFFEDFFEENPEAEEDEDPLPQQRALSLGSGFIISPDGYVVTNNHVISEADEISVRLTDGEDYDAVVVGRDPLSDVALLKIEADHDLPFVEFGDSDAIRVGEWVMTIGNPFGLGGTVTVGIVSARNRDIGNGNYDDFIQTDASINRGNSGGPMFDMEGNVIGVNTMIFSPTGTNIGIGFAIPSNQVSRVVSQLKEFGKTRRGWMGVTIQDITEDVAESLGLDSTNGAIISSVVPDGPSDEAGIEPGDIILKFNGENVEDSRSLPTIVAETPIGIDVEVLILRDGEEETFTLTTGELEAPDDTEEVTEPEEEAPRAPEGDQFLGMLLKPLDQSDREQLEIPEEIEGVLIETLSRRSEAAARGIRPGDVIVQVNLGDVGTVRDVEEAVTAARRLGRSTVLFRIYREGAYFHVPLPIGDE